MAKYQVILTAQNVDSCPVYQEGDQLVINLPEVDLENSYKICAFILAELLHKKLAMEKNLICEHKEEFATKQDYMQEFHLKEGTLRCPRVSCEVSFKMVVSPQLDDISLLQQQQHYTGRADKRDLIAKLKKIPILSAVDPNDLFDILPDLKIKKCQKGDVILKKGQAGRHFCILYDGEVEIVQTASEGKESIIGNLKTGDCFGEMSLLTGEPVSATIRASSPATIILTDRSTFRNLMGKNPVMGLMFTRLLADRIKNTNQRISMVVAAGMAGQLSTIHFPELIQTLSATDCNGILHLSSESTQSKVYFQNGEIIDCTIGEEQGTECFFQLLKWDQGNFRFEQKDIQRERTVIGDPIGLLLEGMRRIDEETKQYYPDDYSGDYLDDLS